MDGYAVPVYAIWTSLDQNLGCAVQIPGSVVWEQLPPAENASELKNVQGPFWIHLVDFSADVGARKQIVNTNKMRNRKSSSPFHNTTRPRQTEI